MENIILDTVNKVDCMGTKEVLKRFDTNEMPLIREVNGQVEIKIAKPFQRIFTNLNCLYSFYSFNFY